MPIWEDEDGFIDILKDEDKYGVFMDMGTGKTSLLLALIDAKFFDKSRSVKKVLIIMPKAVTEATWQDEMKKWDNFNYMFAGLKVINSNLNPAERTKILQSTSEYCIHIISSSLIGWLSGEYVSYGKTRKFIDNKYRPKYDMIIIDECSQFKDTQTNRFKALKRINPPSVFLLSGTPYSNVTEVTRGGKIWLSKADEIYYILYLLDIYKRSLTEFRNDFCTVFPWEKYKYYMGEKTYANLVDAINERSIRKKLELKIALRENKMYCPIDEDKMKELKHDYYITTNGLTNITAANKAIMINKALQLSNGFAYDETGVAIRFNTHKFEMLKGLIDILGNENIVIFYVFREDKAFLLEHLPDAREYKGPQEKDDWNNGKIRQLILSPFGNKYGLNLQGGGHTIVWFGLIWSGESYLQANKRIFRRGQKYDVNVVYLLGEHSFDDYVYEALVSKKKVIDDFISYVATAK